MDDMDAKRTARRRRILENSEKRLSKITGRNEGSESKSQSIHSGLFSQNLADEDVETEPLRLDLNGKITGINGACTRTKLSPPTLLTNRVNYVMLAVLVNVLLLLKLDHLFGKMIAISYFPIILGRLYNYKTSREMQESNLLYAALILCNIKPKLTHQLKKGWYDILDDILQCPVCLDITKTKIYQCNSGHHICQFCRNKLQICPMCKSEFIQTRNLFVEDLISRLADLQVAIDCELSVILAKRRTQQKSVSTETDFAVKEKVSKCTQTYEQVREKFVGKAAASVPCFVNSCQLSFPYLPLVQHVKECHKHVFCEVRATGNVFSQKCIIDTNVLPKRYDFVVHLRNMGLFFFLLLLKNNTTMKAEVIFVNSGVLPIKRFLYELKFESKYVMQKLHRKIMLPKPGLASHCNFYVKQEDTRRLVNGNSFGCTLTIARQDNEV